VLIDNLTARQSRPALAQATIWILMNNDKSILVNGVSAQFAGHGDGFRAHAPQEPATGLQSLPRPAEHLQSLFGEMFRQTGLRTPMTGTVAIENGAVVLHHGKHVTEILPAH